MAIPSSVSSLRALADSAHLLVGAAVDARVLFSGEPEYAETLTFTGNATVAENAFKPSEVWIGPEEYNFSVTDRLADWAEKNGMTLRGHTLVWHNQTPRWLPSPAGAGGADWPSAEELRPLLRKFIQTYVGRYRGRVAMWDVVNEAVEDPEEGAAETGLRESSPWLHVLGAEYLRDAFVWAHEADPDAKLYYNDYECEEMGPKSDAAYRLVAALQAEGAPIHGMGFQGHLLNGWRATEEVRENLRRFAALGLDWQFTEVDVRVELNGAEPTGAQLALQAEGYRDLADLCLTEPGCAGLILWGITDRHSWIPGFRKGWGASLPFDAHYCPKPAYFALCDRLRDR